MHANITVARTPLHIVQPMREMFLHERGMQFVHNKCHEHGWADTYLFKAGDEIAGYGAVWGKDNRKDRDTIFEFYLMPAYRSRPDSFFSLFATTAAVRYAECQTNDPLLAGMFFGHCADIIPDAILFRDRFNSSLSLPGVECREWKDADDRGRQGEYVLTQNERVVASGGFVPYYNHPYIDMYYEVDEAHRGKRFGTYLAQELKKIAYRMNRIPAARCNINNLASKAVLLNAGMEICGYLLDGTLRTAIFTPT